MTVDPFYPGFGNRPVPLVGRQAVVDDFGTALKSAPAHPGRATLLVGQRGMGKTALLLELSAQASAVGFVTARVTASETMLDEILQLIQLEGSRYLPRPQKVKGISAGALGFSLGLTFTDEVAREYGFRVKLSLLCDALAQHGHGVVLLVDEVTATSPQMRELATTYQHLRGENKNLAIVMAGLPTALSSVLHDDVLTFLNRAQRIDLGPLPLNEVLLYYAQAFATAGKTVAPGQLNMLTEATRGYPYLMQLLGHHVILAAGNKTMVTPAIIDIAVSNSRRDMVRTVYEPSLKPLSPLDLDFLKAMAVDAGPSRVGDIRQRMGVSPDMVQQYRSRLLAAGIIASERRGEVEFTLPFLGQYLAEAE